MMDVERHEDGEVKGVAKRKLSQEKGRRDLSPQTPL